VTLIKYMIDQPNGKSGNESKNELEDVLIRAAFVSGTESSGRPASLSTEDVWKPYSSCSSCEFCGIMLCKSQANYE
jgi:hypothetical protein